jgi:hypothetical protein
MKVTKKGELAIFKNGVRTPLIYNGKPITERVFVSDKPLNKEQAISKIQELQKDAKKYGKENYSAIISTKWDHGWRSGKQFNFGAGDEIDLYDPNEYYKGDDAQFEKKFGKARHQLQNSFQEFAIFFLYNGSKKGGASEYNDCLYNSLYSALVCDFPKGWNSKRKFKKRLGLERHDSVHIDNIPAIEEKFKISINVTGDYSYTSPTDCIRKVNLILKNGHYSIDESSKRIVDFDKTLIYDNVKPIAFFRIIDGKKHLVSKDKEWIEELSDKKSKNKQYFEIQSQSTTVTLKQELDYFYEQREILLKATKGLIDMFKYPNPKKAVLRLFFNNTKSITTPDPITLQETEWISKSFQGALLYAKDGQYENVTQIDQNTMYGYYLGSKQLIVPMKEGRFKVMKNEEIKTFAPYGIFRCEIESTDKAKNKLFRFNKHNYYTHYDINNAIKLKFNINLIDDGQANALLYDGESRIYSDKVFNKTIEYLYDLKQKYKLPFIKSMISTIWGGLCEKNCKKVYANEEVNSDFNENNIFSIKSIKKYDDKVCLRYMDKNQTYFKHSFARLGTFLTSLTRYKLSQFIESNFNLNNVYRIHTDSVLTSDPIPKNVIGTEIGKFKVEESGSCRINKYDKPVWI